MPRRSPERHRGKSLKQPPARFLLLCLDLPKEQPDWGVDPNA